MTDPLNEQFLSELDALTEGPGDLDRHVDCIVKGVRARADERRIIASFGPVAALEVLRALARLYGGRKGH